MALPLSQSVEALLESPQAICTLTYKSLDVQNIMASVHDEAAGATAIFIGLYFHYTQLLHGSMTFAIQAPHGIHSKV